MFGTGRPLASSKVACTVEPPTAMTLPVVPTPWMYGVNVGAVVLIEPEASATSIPPVIVVVPTSADILMVVAVLSPAAPLTMDIT